jgi:hypothetical protein
VALAVDYPNAKVPDALAKWEPKKDETPADIDLRVREWQLWWKNAIAVQPQKPARQSTTAKTAEAKPGVTSRPLR